MKLFFLEYTGELPIIALRTQLFILEHAGEYVPLYQEEKGGGPSNTCTPYTQPILTKHPKHTHTHHSIAEIIEEPL